MPWLLSQGIGGSSTIPNGIEGLSIFRIRGREGEPDPWRSDLAPTDGSPWLASLRGQSTEGVKWFCFQRPVPPTPSGAGPGAGGLTRSSGPSIEYVRRNHRTYSGVARTTSPNGPGVTVYVSRGGGSCPPKSRGPNASRSRRSFSLSRLGVTVGVPFGGSGGPETRLQS